MRIAGALLLMLLEVGSLGQDRFRTGTDAVRVDVLVSDGNRPVTGLDASDFTLLDNGVPQAIDVLAVEHVPVSMMLALDTSESVAGRPLRSLIQAAGAASSALGTDDRASLLTFSEEVRLRAPWARGSGLAGILPSLTAGGATSLVDAAFAAITLREAAPDRRHLLLLFTDGDDTSSWLPWRAVLDGARRSDVVVYGVTLDDPRRSGRSMPLPAFVRGEEAPTDFLARLADATGGRVFRARNVEGLRDTFTRVVQEFRGRYLLTYSPRNVDTPGWHTLEVKLRRGKGDVRARRGYNR